MITVGRLARRYNLSRSTLLYYDSIGLLSPAQRGSSNYREYTEEDCRRLNQICIYREAGVPLESIKAILDAEKNSVIEHLEKRLEALNHEIRLLRQQQCYITALLQTKRLDGGAKTVDRRGLAARLDAAGVDEQARHLFHYQFEQSDPDRHQALLEFLGLGPEDIRAVRAQSAAGRRADHEDPLKETSPYPKERSDASFTAHSPVLPR